ncbi:MAG: hypothetical protein AB8C84_04595, partial [Oligoflexales bacterium]
NYRYNEALDCFVGCLAQRDVLGYTRWTEAHWQEFEPSQKSESHFQNRLKAGQGALIPKGKSV